MLFCYKPNSLTLSVKGIHLKDTGSIPANDSHFFLFIPLIFDTFAPAHSAPLSRLARRHRPRAARAMSGCGN